jgi:hypothetical protein
VEQRKQIGGGDSFDSQSVLRMTGADAIADGLNGGGQLVVF